MGRSVMNFFSRIKCALTSKAKGGLVPKDAEILREGEMKPSNISDMTAANNFLAVHQSKLRRVLFIARQKGYSPYSHCWNGRCSGLFISVQFMVTMLKQLGITAQLAEVIDNNGIDRVVTQFKPTHCIIEAVWVVPQKFAILTKLHPNVKWIVRVHSNLSFLALEGFAMGWLLDYLSYDNVGVSFNSLKAFNDFIFLLNVKYGLKYSGNIFYQPNWYDMKGTMVRNLSRIARNRELPNKDHHFIDVGCFGAIRLLKNQLVQAVAAIRFAKTIGRYLRFHVNSARVEGYSANSILNNLRNLFAAIPNTILIEHPWMDHEDFLSLVECMDIGLQVSFSETFNITAADFVNTRIPLVTSSEIDWLDTLNFADPTNEVNIAEKMLIAYRNLDLIGENYNSLKAFCSISGQLWPSTLI